MTLAQKYIKTNEIPTNKKPRKLVKDIVKRLERNGAMQASLQETEITEICYRSREQLMRDETMLDLKVPIIIVGDVHGQFEDLLGIFELNGHPSKRRYLFLGDYVDRGQYSIATVVLLLCYKLLYPENVYLLRGNHETRFINRVYGFYEECTACYDAKLWLTFQTVFDCLPLCARISGRIFCMHGGLSPQIKRWETLRKLRRPTDIPDFGVLCDLIWADPNKDVSGFTDNPRGVSCSFGEDVVYEFCQNMKIDMIVRAHQVVQDGYEFFANRRLITIFSAPFYCGRFDNAGAVMFVDYNLRCQFYIRRPKDHVWTKKIPKRATTKRLKKRRKCLISASTTDDDSERSIRKSKRMKKVGEKSIRQKSFENSVTGSTESECSIRRSTKNRKKKGNRRKN